MKENRIKGVIRSVDETVVDIAKREISLPVADRFAAIGKRLAEGIAQLASATRWIVENAEARPLEIAAGAVAYLKLSGYVMGGWMMARAALIAERQLDAGGDAGFYRAKIATARFYVEHILPQYSALADTVTGGAASVLALEESQF